MLYRARGTSSLWLRSSALDPSVREALPAGLPSVNLILPTAKSLCPPSRLNRLTLHYCTVPNRSKTSAVQRPYGSNNTLGMMKSQDHEAGMIQRRKAKINSDDHGSSSVTSTFAALIYPAYVGKQPSRPLLQTTGSSRPERRLCA